MKDALDRILENDARRSIAEEVRACERVRSMKPCASDVPAGAKTIARTLPSAAEPITSAGLSQARSRARGGGNALITRVENPSSASSMPASWRNSLSMSFTWAPFRPGAP